VKPLTTHFYLHGQIKISKRLPVEDSASCKRNCKSKSRSTFIKYFVTKICVNAKQHCLGQHETRTACSAVVHTEHQCHVISQTYRAQERQSYFYTPCHNNTITGVAISVRCKDPQVTYSIRFEALSAASTEEC
jgi:hypothetical protein